MVQLNDKLRGLAPYEPNGGDHPIRLDANESFLQLPEGIRAEILDSALSVPLNRYPDPTAKQLCGAFAARYGVPAACVAAGNGSDELISILLQCFLMKGEAFATLAPDFSMYSFYGHLAECKHVEIKKGENFEADIDKIIEICNNECVRLLIFSNPCNPTGLCVPAGEIRRLVKSVSALVVLDEAYMDFHDQSLLGECAEYDNLLILRTCSKAFGMAALRVGFAVGNETLIRAVKAAKSPYNVNTISQIAAEAVLRHTAECDDAICQIVASRKSLQSGLEALARRIPSLKVIPSTVNFVTVLLEQAGEIFQFLLDSGIAVRYFAGLSALRITAGTAEENAAVLAAVERYFK